MLKISVSSARRKVKGAGGVKGWGGGGERKVKGRSEKLEDGRRARMVMGEEKEQVGEVVGGSN